MNPLGNLAIYRGDSFSRQAYETPALPLSYTAGPRELDQLQREILSREWSGLPENVAAA
jgi:hypothetical protein